MILNLSHTQAKQDINLWTGEYEAELDHTLIGLSDKGLAEITRIQTECNNVNVNDLLTQLFNELFVVLANYSSFATELL